MFTNCISKVNNTQIDNAKELDVVIPICNLLMMLNQWYK